MRHSCTTRVRPAFRLFVLAALGTVASSQEPPEVVRITLSLIQIDAVVTDKGGHAVTNLQASDFEVLEDGRSQQITNCVYISTAGPPVSATSPAPALAPAPLRPTLQPEEVRRTLALVVDDLGLSLEGTVNVRRSLEKFVDEQMQPGDLVAVARTSTGMDLPPRFTMDKAQLRIPIDQLRFEAFNRSGVDAFEPVGQFKTVNEAPSRLPKSTSASGESVERLRESLLTAGTLASLDFVIRCLRDLPGRKGVVLFSDGFPVLDADRRVRGALSQLIDAANRASVVVYAVDTKGMATLAFTAADDINTKLGNGDVQQADFNSARASRFLRNVESRQGLQQIAAETGGFLVQNQNDVSAGLGRILEDQGSYYLIGYVPDPSAYRAGREGPSFHKIKVKLKRPGLQVRSRSGFFGVVP